MIKHKVKLQIQLLNDDSQPVGPPWIEICCVEPHVERVKLLSGVELRNKFWSGLSRGAQGMLALADTKTGMSSTLPL